MTTETTDQQAACLTILASHGFASIDDAREENVFRACGGCGSIMACTPAPGQTRDEQVVILRESLILDCCPDADEYYF